jgi:ABC-type glycerol-3-phosphate transport system substrate-binding protein
MPTRKSMVVILATVFFLALPVSAAEQVEMMFWVNGWPQAAVDAIQKISDLFAAEHPQVKSVTVLPVSQNQLVEKLTLNVVGDTAPDLITLPAPFIQYQVKGLLQPIETYLAKSRIINRQDYPANVMATFAVDGVQYGIPGIEVGVGLLLVYNMDLFAEAGLPETGPTTLTDIVQMHKKLTRQDPNTGTLTHVGIHPMDSMGGTYFPTVWSTVFDVPWYNPQTRQLNLVGFEEAVEWIASIYNTYSYDMINGAGIGGWTGGLTKGRLGMQINGSWVPGELKSLNSTWRHGYTWMPTIRDDKATAALPWGLGVPTNAKHPDLSFQLMEYFTTAQATQIMFDAVGWLSGNLSAMRRLVIRDLPVIAQCVAMFDQADRFNAPLPVPIMETIRNSTSNVLTPVWRGQTSPRAALETWQQQMQIELNNAFAER